MAEDKTYEPPPFEELDDEDDEEEEEQKGTTLSETSFAMMKSISSPQVHPSHPTPMYTTRTHTQIK